MKNIMILCLMAPVLTFAQYESRAVSTPQEIGIEDVMISSKVRVTYMLE